MTLATVLFKKTAGPFDFLQRAGASVANAVGATPAATPAPAPKAAESAPPSEPAAPATPAAPKPPGFMDQVSDMASKGWDATKDLGNKHMWGDAKGSPYDGKASLPSEYLKGLQTGHVGTIAGTVGGICAAALLGHLLFSNKKRRQA